MALLSAQCGATIQAGKEFCPNCGTRLANSPSPAPQAPVNPGMAPNQGPVFGNTPNNQFGNVPPMNNGQPMGGMNNQFNQAPNNFNNNRGMMGGMPPQEPPKPKKKVPVLPIVLIALLVLIGIGVGTFFVLLNNNYLYEHGQLAKIYNVTGKCLQHHFQEADCTHPETCEICGLEQGEPLGHDWSEATCTEPKTCKVCGETEGDPLGHTTQLGVCDRCGKYQDDLEDVFYDIKDAISSGLDYLDSFDRAYGRYNPQTYEEAYSFFTYYQDYIDEAIEVFNEAIELCGDHEEFADIKSALEKIVGQLPSKEPDATYSAIDNHLAALGEAWDTWDVIVDEVNEIQDMIDKNS